jgi:intracellular septation protein
MYFALPATSIHGYMEGMTVRSRAWLRPTMEYGPLAVFFVAYIFGNLIVATGALMAATVVALAASYILERRVPAILVITATVVLVFGTLTIVLDDERFIKMKPTIIYGLFAVALLGGQLIGKPVLKMLLSAAWQLTEQGWRTLTYRFGLFFVVMTVLNEVVWRTQSTDFWVNYKLFGTIVLTLAFTAFQAPLIMRCQIDQAEGPAPGGGDSGS